LVIKHSLAFAKCPEWKENKKMGLANFARQTHFFRSFRDLRAGWIKKKQVAFRHLLE